MRVAVDSGECIGSGMCTRIAPLVFELDERADVARVVIRAPLSGEQLELAQDAVACCPVEAISLRGEGAE